MKKLIVLLIAAAPSCAMFQKGSLLDSAEKITAEILCAQTFSEKYGISLEDAKNVYCGSREVLRPFLFAVKQANQDAKFAAGPVGLKAAEEIKK